QQYHRAADIINAFWVKHPPGTQIWVAESSAAYKIGRDPGVNFGIPACYYALRMLTDCTQWRQRQRASAQVPKQIILTVVLSGRSRGVEPASRSELDRKTGGVVQHSLNASVTDNNHQIIDQSLWLFREYIAAATDGRLS